MDQPKRYGLALNPDKLLGAIEAYAEGDFDTLMNYEWRSLERFYKSGCDFIEEKYHTAFKQALEEAFPGRVWR